jgi:hypothetical protein
VPRLQILWSPWTWVVVAAAFRVGLLVSLPGAAPQIAIAPIPPRQRAALPQGVVPFLEARVQLEPLTEDEHEYDEVARNLVAGRGFVLDSKWLISTPGQPTAFPGFGYPAFVASVYAVFGAGNELPVFLIQIALAALAARWIVLAAARVGGGVAGAIGGAFYAAHPTLIWSSVAMMSEALCVPLVVALLSVLARPSRHAERRAIALAGLLVLLCLVRSTFTLFPWIIAGVLLFEARKRPFVRQRLAPCLVFGLAFLTFATPWAVRNYVHWKRLIPFSTKVGTNAWVHNHPGLTVEFSERAVSGTQPIDVFDARIQDLPDEGAREAKLQDMFLRFLASNPLKFLGLVWMRFWMALLPVAVVSRSPFAAATAWYAKGTVLLSLLFAIRLIPARRFYRLLPWLLFAGYWMLMQSLAGSGLRYRIPVDPAWACIVGVLWAAILAVLRRREAAVSLVQWPVPVGMGRPDASDLRSRDVPS